MTIVDTLSRTPQLVRDINHTVPASSSNACN